MLFRRQKLRKLRASKPRNQLDYSALETRSMLAADLIGIGFQIPSNAETGATIPVQWSVMNNGTTPAYSYFDVSFYIRNSQGTTQYLGNAAAPPLNWWPLAGSVYSSTTQLKLPDLGSAFYTSSGNYQIRMQVDTFNQVPESNEINNAYRGLGIDYGFVFVNPFRPDLSASGITVSPNKSKYNPSDIISVVGQVANNGNSPSGAFSIGVYLSEEATISKSDHLLGSVNISSLGVNSSFGFNANVSLPQANHAIWQRFSNKFYVGFIVDRTEQVFESNEANNSNRGVGVDKIAISLDSTIDLTQLPGTPFAPGQLTKYFLEASKKSFDSFAGQLKKDGMALKNILDLSNFGSAVSGVSKELANWIKTVSSVLKTNKPLQINSSNSLSVQQLELADRLLGEMLRKVIADDQGSNLQASEIAAVSTSKFASASNSDEIFQFKQTINKVLDTYSPARIYGEAAKTFTQFAGAANAVGLSTVGALAGAASGIAGAVGAMARMGRAKVLGGDQTGLIDQRHVLEDSVPQVLLEELKNKFRNLLPGASSSGAKLLELLDDLQTLRSALDRYLESANGRYSETFNALRGAMFTGTWIGTQTSTVTLNGSTYQFTDPISITFKKTANGIFEATRKYVFANLDAMGNVIKKTQKTSTFVGSFSAADRFNGTETLTDQSGAKHNLPVQWSFDGENFGGSWYQGSTTTFSVKKK